MKNNYEKLMKRCLKLAAKAEGNTSPNPLVGAVIFDDDFNIISEGFHEKYGENHAEVNAILNAKTKNLNNYSIAVNLEPCSHYGKTPPCADMIISKGFKKVIIGMSDPNPLVGGRGISKLKDAGIEVICGVLESECRKLNEAFIKNHTKKLPFVLIKTATTLDGKIACENGHSKWITGERARLEVQKLRNKYDAILTGSNTVIKDNPSLNCRLSGKKSPVRVIIDSKLVTSPNSNVYKDDGVDVIVFAREGVSNSRKNEYPKNIEIIESPLKSGCDKVDLQFVLNKLYEKNLMSVMVEAGAMLNMAFIKEGFADKLVQFIAPKIVGDKMAKNFVEGLSVLNINNSVPLFGLKTKKMASDIMLEAYFTTDLL